VNVTLINKEQARRINAKHMEWSLKESQRESEEYDKRRADFIAWLTKGGIDRFLQELNVQIEKEARKLYTLRDGHYVEYDCNHFNTKTENAKNHWLAEVLGTQLIASGYNVYVSSGTKLCIRWKEKDEDEN
jgi:hypothetical protein